MKGHMHRQSGESWRLTVYAGKDPLTGKSRQIQRTVRGTRGEAENELARLVVDVEDGKYGRTDVPVAELMERWLAHTHLAPYTRNDYQRIVSQHILPVFGKTRLSRLRTADLDGFYDRLQAGGLGPARIYKVHTVMRSALRQAVRWQWIGINPAISASPPPVPRPDIVPPTPDDIGLLLEEAERSDPALLAFVYLAAASGARRGELCALQWGDLNDSTRSMRVARSVWAVGGDWGIKETKTNRVRVVALTAATVEILAAHRRRCREESLLWGMAFDPETFVFAREGNNRAPWRPDTTSHRFRRLCERAGLERKTSLHGLRHYVATSLIGAGVDPVSVAARLGHAKPSMTLDQYSAFLPAKDGESASILDGLLSRQKPPVGPGASEPPAPVVGPW